MLVQNGEMDPAEKKLIVNIAGQMIGEDGQLDFDEFVLLVEALEAEQYTQHQESANNGLQEWFDMKDTDQDGLLDDVLWRSEVDNGVNNGEFDKATGDFLFQLIGF